MTWETLTLRLALALVFGGLIGLERQCHARYVGLRTNSLVTIASTAITSLVFKTPTDPAAIVHVIAGIIVGVGFLGAGVIFHDGKIVRGCNTAATLWCSVAVGLYTGSGYFIDAAILTSFIVLINLFMRPISHQLNKKQ